MNQVTIQLDVVVALYLLFSWCNGGITNINCSGNIWVEPATIVKMGMNISVYCQAAIKNCQPRKFHFYKNSIKERLHITRINGTTARLWYENFREPRASMYCTAECPGYFQETLICGKDISSGYPPDAPEEVACVIHEQSGNMTCTWGTGKPTYIDTTYVVHVKSIETEEEQQYLTSSYINISTDSLPGGKEYLVWVQATNVLGMKESKRLQVHLDDIVIPSASVISRAETTNAIVDKTVIYWNSETAIEKVSCEMRYKATTNHTWNVKEFDANFTCVQQSEFYLEPNINYIFQVRCQERGKRYWQPWSSPFFHHTPDTEPSTRNIQKGPCISSDKSLYEVTPKLFQRDVWNSGMLTASIYKGHRTFGNRQNIGLLSGMIAFAAMLSIFSLIGIFNRSLRTGIKRKILLLIPKWLHEDIPNMENSNVVKMLQEESEFMNNNPREPVLYVDPMITEIREIFLAERKPTDYKKEKKIGALDFLQTSPFTNTNVVYIPDLNTGYKPQISNFAPQGNHFSNHDEVDFSIPELPADSLDVGKNVRLKECPNFAFPFPTMTSLSNTLILEELSLILNQGECHLPDTQNSMEGETTRFLESDLPNESTLEQTLLPDEFVSSLGTMNDDLPSVSSYFPQNILESHFNRISLLEK